MQRAWLLALGVALLGPATALAKTDAARPVPPLHDAVVVDTSARTAFVMSPKGGIEAIDLATGAAKWRSQAAARPLMVTDGTLVAQAPPAADEQLVIVSLDTAQGGTRGRVKVALPPGMRAGVVDTPSQKTHVHGLQDSSGDVVVVWSLEPRGTRGMAPLDEEPKEVHGATRIDPETGHAVALSEDAVADVSEAARSTFIIPPP